jgi:hypothetical protein
MKLMITSRAAVLAASASMVEPTLVRIPPPAGSPLWHRGPAQSEGDPLCVRTIVRFGPAAAVGLRAFSWPSLVREREENPSRADIHAQ